MVQDDETLAGLLRRNAGVRAGAPAILAGDASVSHEALAEAALRLAGGLANLGLAPGQRLAVYVRKTPQAIMAFLAAAAAGGVFFPLDPNQPPDVTRAILDRLAPSDRKSVV